MVRLQFFLLGVGFVSLLASSCLKSPSPNHLSLPSQKEIQHYYQIGKAECLSHIKHSHDELLKHPIQPHYLLNWSVYTPRPYCRGTPMLYQLTRQFPWNFGPKNCSTYESCWMGVLTCSLEGVQISYPLDLAWKTETENAMKSIINTTRLTSHRLTNLVYQGWSIKSLRIQMRLIGFETIALEQQMMTILDEKANIKTEVILGMYTLTLPGLYKFEAKLLDMNPMKLYQWTSDEKKHGYDMLFPIYLGGTEARCKPYQGCKYEKTCCGCWELAAIPGMRTLLTIADSFGSCHSHFSSSFQTSLPFCSRGNHSGRWLQIPSFVEKHCNPSSPPMSPSLLWNEITELLQDGQASFASRKKGLLSDDLIHLLELSRCMCLLSSLLTFFCLEAILAEEQATFVSYISLVC
jgi:hypothetical protein